MERHAVVAGSFYPASADEITKTSHDVPSYMPGADGIASDKA